MSALLSLLDTYPSMLQPAVAAVLLVVTVLMTVAFLVNPQWFVPAVVLSAPIPKLFSVGLRSDVTSVSDLTFTRVPGASVVDLVILSGFLAVVLRATYQRRKASAWAPLDRWTLVCGLVVVGSLVLNGLIGTVGVDAAAWLYAARYIAAMVVFFLSKDSAQSAGYDTAWLLRILQWSGNLFIVLGLLYYFYGGGMAWVDASLKGQVIGNAQESGLFRTPLYFFDYGYDFGLYIVLVVLLNLMAAMFARSPIRLALYGFFALLGTVALMLLAERGNWIAMLVAMSALPFALARAHKGHVVRAAVGSATIVILFSAASIAAFVAFSSDAMVSKIANSTGVRTVADTVEVAQDLNLPRAVADVVSALPIGDMGIRLMYMIASVREAFARPWGVGFFCELTVVGWYAHHDLIKIFVELGLFGLVAFGMMMRSAWQTLGNYDLASSDEDLNALGVMRAYFLGLGVTMLLGTGVIMLLKVTSLIWCVLGAVVGLLTRMAPDTGASQAAVPFRPVLVRDASGISPRR